MDQGKLRSEESDLVIAVQVSHVNRKRRIRWPNWRPLLMTSASQFRPPVPPACESPQVSFPDGQRFRASARDVGCAAFH